MAVEAGLIGPTTLAISQAIGAFNTFLPPIADIRKNNPIENPDFAADVRMGEVAAVVITMGVGAIVSSLTGSSAPAMVALLASLGLIVLYESTLRADRPMQREA